jgi:hypothetical protein
MEPERVDGTPQAKMALCPAARQPRPVAPVHRASHELRTAHAARLARAI